MVIVDYLFYSKYTKHLLEKRFNMTPTTVSQLDFCCDIDKIIDSLPSNESAIIRFIHEEGFSHSEVTKMTGQSIHRTLNQYNLALNKVTHQFIEKKLIEI